MKGMEQNRESQPTRSEYRVECADLCTPSMGGNQKGFKSPVYRMNIER